MECLIAEIKFREKFAEAGDKKQEVRGMRYDDFESKKYEVGILDFGIFLLRTSK